MSDEGGCTALLDAYDPTVSSRGQVESALDSEPVRREPESRSADAALPIDPEELRALILKHDMAVAEAYFQPDEPSLEPERA